MRIKKAVSRETAFLLCLIFKCEAMGTELEVEDIASESVALDLEIAHSDFGDIARC